MVPTLNLLSHHTLMHSLTRSSNGSSNKKNKKVANYLFINFKCWLKTLVRRNSNSHWWYGMAWLAVQFRVKATRTLLFCSIYFLDDGQPSNQTYNSTIHLYQPTMPYLHTIQPSAKGTVATCRASHVTFPKGFWCFVGILRHAAPSVGMWYLLAKCRKAVLRCCCWMFVCFLVLIFNHFNRAGWVY